MVAVSRSTRISKSTPLSRKNIYYLLSLIHYLLSKVPRLCNGFLSVRSAGVLFRAKSVRAGLVTARKYTSPQFWAAPSAARTKLDFRYYILDFRWWLFRGVPVYQKAHLYREKISIIYYLLSIIYYLMWKFHFFYRRAQLFSPM